MFQLCKAQKYQYELSVCILFYLFSHRYMNEMLNVFLNIHDNIFNFNY